MKKKCAVFTIVKNESYFLPKWIKHFKKYFDSSDIYILDHQSTDGSTSNIDVNVIEVVNELTFDHQWLLNTVQDFQSKLLTSYQCVLFCEADELLYCLNKPLNEMIDDFISDNDCKYITANGYELKQEYSESDLTLEDEIITNRNWWFKSHKYTKTLLSKIELSWVWGFHYALKDKSVYMYEVGNSLDYNFSNTNGNDFNLYLIHLHRFDFELLVKRHEERANWNHKYDGGGNHNRVSDRQTLLRYFCDLEGSVMEKIPESHKIQLYGI